MKQVEASPAPRAKFFAKVTLNPSGEPGTYQIKQTEVFTSSKELIDFINLQYPSNKGFTVFRKYEQ